jgi:4-oxalocrotonate tautomerase
MPIINIDMMSGRTIDQKRNLVKEITKVVCKTIDTTPDRVKIKLSEMSPEDYAISGQLIVDQDDPFGKKK